MSMLVCLRVQPPGDMAYSTDRSMQSTVETGPSTAMATGPAHSLMMMAAKDDKVVLGPHWWEIFGPALTRTFQVSGPSPA